MAAVIAEGKDVTYNLKPYATDPTAVGTREMADAISPKLGGWQICKLAGHCDSALSSSTRADGV